MIYLLYKRCKIASSPEDIEIFQKYYGTLFEEFNSNGISSWQYYPLFVLKRLSIVFTIFFVTIPVLQLSISITFTLFVSFIQMVFYLLTVSPFLDRNMQRSLLAGEICVILVYGGLLLPFISEINISTSQLGAICIIIMLISMGTNVIFNVMSSAVGICSWVRLWKSKRYNEILPVSNIMQTESDHVSPRPKI